MFSARAVTCGHLVPVRGRNGARARACVCYLKARHVWLAEAYTWSVFTRVPGGLYVSDKGGSDQDGDGTEQRPFKTPLKVNPQRSYKVLPPTCTKRAEYDLWKVRFESDF